MSIFGNIKLQHGCEHEWFVVHKELVEALLGYKITQPTTVYQCKLCRTIICQAFDCVVLSDKDESGIPMLIGK